MNKCNNPDDSMSVSEIIERLAILRNNTVPDSRDYIALSAGIAALIYPPAWILLDEKLPEPQERYAGMSDDVIVCLERTDCDRVYRELFAGYYDGRGKWYTYMHNGCSEVVGDDKVVAWMPMPKIYHK